MMRLLNIQTSTPGPGSVTRALSARFLARWRARHPGAEVIERDLGQHPLPPLDPALVQALYGNSAALDEDAAQAAHRSAILIEELKSVGYLLIGLPMYNFTVPTAFKTWIDHVYRYGMTVERTPSGPRGLLSGIEAVVIATSGGFYAGDAGLSRNHQIPYVRTILDVLGIRLAQVIVAEGLTRGEAARHAAIKGAEADIDALLGAPPHPPGPGQALGAATPAVLAGFQAPIKEDVR